MPEGPEVEVIRRNLKTLEGKIIKSIELTSESQKYKKYQGKKGQFSIFNNSTLVKIERKGKYLIWHFSIEKVILNHLGMSGKWLIFSDQEEAYTKHSKVKILTNDSIIAIFDDSRNFGQFRVFNSYHDLESYKPIKSLGPDGLAIPFPTEEFLRRLEKEIYSNREIGEVLLNQQIIAGIGNIYKSESLFLARIKPTRTVRSLSKSEKLRLATSISTVLNKALSNNGSSIQSYITPTGEIGKAQLFHQVYRKSKCPICGSHITKIKQKGRSTYFCPKCQR